MPALLERTKVKANETSAATNENWVIGDLAQQSYHSDKPFSVDVYAYGLLPGSTRVTVLPYLPQPSKRAKENLKKIYRFLTLPSNWDNEGAVPPEEKIVLAAYYFILQMDELDLPIYFVAPGPNGEIYFEYKNKNNTAEMFFNEDESSAMILYKGKEQTYSGEVNIDLLIDHLR
jgi:hypothetical protein